MKLITKQLERLFEKYPLYSQDGKGKGATVLAVFRLAVTGWTWYVLEAERQSDGDWLFFGLVDGHKREYGYFTLSQLTGIDIYKKIRVVRDTSFQPARLGDTVPKMQPAV